MTPNKSNRALRYIPVITEDHLVLGNDEKEQIRQMLQSQPFKWAMEIARRSTPSVFLQNSGGRADELSKDQVNNRFHEMKGWNMFEAALIASPEVKSASNDELEEYQTNNKI